MMEGPSLFLAQEQLAPFINKKILEVTGNTKFGKERLFDKKVLDIFSWGKHLVFQFDEFAFRVHFMMFGSFQATVQDKKVTGDYPRKKREPRLALTFKNGHIEMYSCSLKFIESSNAKKGYNYLTDIMSPEWSLRTVLNKVRKHPDTQIGDLLMDQSIFTGVGNIIKNEVLFIVKLHPEALVGGLSNYKLRQLVKETRKFVFKFYEWRKVFELRKHYQIYKKKKCTICEGPVIKIYTGFTKRRTFVCLHCQKGSASIA